MLLDCWRSHGLLPLRNRTVLSDLAIAGSRLWTSHAAENGGCDPMRFPRPAILSLFERGHHLLESALPTGRPDGRRAAGTSCSHFRFQRREICNVRVVHVDCRFRAGRLS